MCPHNSILLTDPTVLIFERASGEVKCVVLKQQPVVAVHRTPKLGVRKNKLAVFSFHNFARLQDSTILTALNPDMRAYNRTSATSKQPHYPLVQLLNRGYSPKRIRSQKDSRQKDSKPKGFEA